MHSNAASLHTKLHTYRKQSTACLKSAHFTSKTSHLRTDRQHSQVQRHTLCGRQPRWPPARGAIADHEQLQQQNVTTTATNTNNKQQLI